MDRHTVIDRKMTKQVDHVVNLVTMLRTDKIAREGASKSGNMKEIT